jgi:hypothetical protein
MGMNVKPSSLFTVLDTLNPVSQGAGASSSAWVDGAAYESLCAIVLTGVLGASGTLDAKFEQATTAAGAGVKDVPGSNLTQIVKATGDNKQAIIELQNEQLDTNNGFRWVRLTTTTAVAAGLMSAIVLGFGARYQPATHDTTLVEIKQVRA